MWFKRLMFKVSIIMLRRFVLKYWKGDDKFWSTIEACWISLNSHEVRKNFS